MKLYFFISICLSVLACTKGDPNVTGANSSEPDLSQKSTELVDQSPSSLPSSNSSDLIEESESEIIEEQGEYCTEFTGPKNHPRDKAVKCKEDEDDEEKDIFIELD